MKKIIFTIAILTIFAVQNAFSAEEFKFNKNKFDQWVSNFIIQARAEGVSDQAIKNFTNNLEFVPKTIKLDRRQPYKTTTFDQYTKNIIPQSRVKKAVDKIVENRELLYKVSNKYGVKPSIIVALWAIESNFGGNMGSFNIPNSLASLAFEGRREKFFTRELISALKIIDQGHISYDDMKGSWAGAMGQTQFMPSSFLELAVDFDRDNKKDIWGTKADAFGSIANYLNKRGWKSNQIWGFEVSVPMEIDDSLISSKIKKPLSFWKEQGVLLPSSANKYRLDDDIMASVVKPEKDKVRAFMVFNNYHTILNWNRSLYFATSVGLLSDAIDQSLEELQQ